MNNLNQKVITRFAPSPTGFMHVGNLRSALFTYLLAKKNNGTLILRIEDTDKEREVLGAKEHIQKVLKWIGINWDEGPDIGGPHAPYTQSERLALYKKYAQVLIDKGLAYADPYTEDEVQQFRDKAVEEKKLFLYRNHRPLNPPIWDGTKPLRFKVSEIKSYHWNDLVFGDLSAGPEALDDFILIKSDGYPTYNFCHIVDDIEMGITHVVRGQEYISSIPKYLSLYESLGVTPPIFVCLPHIMGKNGIKKLGKRDGAKDSLEYKEDGYLPEALVNFLALLGWHPSGDREIFTMSELLEHFEVNRIQKSGAQWNDEKLDWINKEHMKKLPAETLKERIFEYLPSELKNEKLIPLISERISKFSDVKKMLDEGELDFFYKEPQYDASGLYYKDTSKEQITINLQSAIDDLSIIKDADFNKEYIKQILMKIADEKENRGQVLHPIRFALSGLAKSPDPFILAEILEKNKTINRLQIAIQKLKE